MTRIESGSTTKNQDQTTDADFPAKCFCDICRDQSLEGVFVLETDSNAATVTPEAKAVASSLRSLSDELDNPGIHPL